MFAFHDSEEIGPGLWGGLCGDVQAAGSRRWSHRRKDSWVSPDLRPARRLATLMSSSRSGQWIPSPPPMRRQLARSGGVPCAKRGNQASGTVIVRPSARSTTRSSSPALTLWATACARSCSEVLIPCPRQQTCVFRHQPFDASDLRTAEAAAAFQPPNKRTSGTALREERSAIHPVYTGSWSVGAVADGLSPHGR